MKLRTALLLNGVSPHNGRSKVINCRGIGTCGTCAVEVDGDVVPPQWSDIEKARLNFPPHKAPGNQSLRLACQVRCHGDVEVTKRDRFWGQGDAVMGQWEDDEEGEVVPFRQLEFLLDRESWEEVASKYGGSSSSQGQLPEGDGKKAADEQKNPKG